MSTSVLAIAAILAGCGHQKPRPEQTPPPGCEAEAWTLARIKDIRSSLSSPGATLPADNVVFVLRVANGQALAVPRPARCTPYMLEAQPIAQSIVPRHVPEIRAALQTECSRITRNYHDTLSQQVRAEFAQHLAKLGEPPGECAPVQRP